MATIEQRIEHNLKLGRLSLVKDALNEKYNSEHKSAWLEAMRAEYDVLFPTTRLMTELEWNEVNESDLTWSELCDEDKSELFIVIDYSEDENYVTFNDWINETRVIQEAVAEVWDEQGLDLLVEAVPEITEQVRPYTSMTTEEVTSQVDSYIYAATLPKVITMRQARLALLNAGLLTTVINAIETGTDEALKIEWEYATEVKRDWASLITMATTLGMTSEQLDGLFITGNKL